MGIFEILAMLKGLKDIAPEAITAVVTGLSGIIAVCMAIPGRQPEAFLQKIVDLISRWSRK